MPVLLSLVTSVLFSLTKLFFELQFRLSVFTSNKLPPELQAVKRKLGLRLIKFEDAGVDLGGFVKQHPFETSQFLFSSIIKHYQQVCS